MQTSETTYENKQVRVNKCGYDYDAYAGKDVYKCRDTYEYRQVPVTKTVYRVSNGVVPRTFPNALGAVANIAGYGATRWRQVASARPG